MQSSETEKTMRDERYKATGEGTVKEVEKGRVYRIKFRYKDTLANNGQGKWLQSPQKTVKGNKAMARRELHDYMREFIAEKNDNVSDKKLSAYAREWHEYRVSMEAITPLSLQREAGLIDKIEKYLPDVLLVELGPHDIEDALMELKKDGYSDGEIRRVYNKLGQILKAAMQKGDIKVSPTMQMEPPKKPKQGKRDALSEEEAVRLANILRDEPKCDVTTVMTLLLYLGLRRGEALGLRWMDVDLDKKLLSIVHQYDRNHELREPKCSSRRELSIADGATDVYLTELKQYVSEQYFGGGEVPGDFPVCCTKSGDFVDPTRINKTAREFFVKHGFGTYGAVEDFYDKNGNHRYHKRGYTGACLHTLRHTQATQLLAHGTDVKTVQARLGHASATMTLNRYAHAVPGNERRAAETIGSILG